MKKKKVLQKDLDVLYPRLYSSGCGLYHNLLCGDTRVDLAELRAKVSKAKKVDVTDGLEFVSSSMVTARSAEKLLAGIGSASMWSKIFGRT